MPRVQAKLTDVNSPIAGSKLVLSAIPADKGTCAQVVLALKDDKINAVCKE